jgi:hypothetical protein
MLAIWIPLLAMTAISAAQAYYWRWRQAQLQKLLNRFNNTPVLDITELLRYKAQVVKVSNGPLMAWLQRRRDDKQPT